MIVAGVMSGTSADGIDVAITEIGGHGFKLRLKVLGYKHAPYPRNVRAAILRAMNAAQVSVGELSRLNFLLGELYADAVHKALQTMRISKLDLVGCHGQTIYHQGEGADFLGRKVKCTWQTGEGAIIAARLGVPVVSDFRPADMAAGGKGAPLVPFLDYVLFRDARAGRIAQNIGGIANLTAIPASAKPEDVIAFDTGPGNMVIDALALKLFGKAYDRNGAIAATGRVLEPVLGKMLRNPYFRLKPPRSAGREEFGREYAAQFLSACRTLSRRPEDALATATALTARSIARSFEQFVWPAMKRAPIDYIVSGGGARNRTLMKVLASSLEPLGCALTTTEQFGLPAEAKEAAAFALLAWTTWNRLPGNVPSATGAKRFAILGQITYA